MPKTAHAPNISELEATCQHLIGLYRDRFIDAKLIDVPRGEKIKSKLDLEIRFPRPEINIVPLASSVSINKAISQFSVLKEFSVTLVDTNNEIDSSDFFRKFREQREDLGATGTALSHTNSKEGLNRRAAAKELEAAMGSGSSYIKLSGIDKDGLAMKRTNQDISLREPATFEPSTPKENSINLFFALSRVISRGIVAAPRFAADAGKKLATFIAKHMRSSAGAAPPVKGLPDHTVAPARVLEAKPVVESPTKKTRARKR
jgi:hypothetical protein